VRGEVIRSSVSKSIDLPGYGLSQMEEAHLTLGMLLDSKRYVNPSLVHQLSKRGLDPSDTGTKLYENELELPTSSSPDVLIGYEAWRILTSDFIRTRPLPPLIGSNEFLQKFQQMLELRQKNDVLLKILSRPQLDSKLRIIHAPAKYKLLRKITNFVFTKGKKLSQR
jgi:hypothetical protein